MLLRVGLLILALLASALCQAFNGAFLRSSIYQGMTAQEVELIKAAAKQALGKADGDIYTWQHESGLQGEFEPRFSYSLQGQPCRRLRFVLIREGKKRISHFDFCQSNGLWQVVESPVAALDNDDWQYFRSELYYVLTHGEDARPVSWVLPSRHASGVFTPLSPAGECRTVGISIINAVGVSSDGVYKFCQDAKGNWQRQDEN